MIVSRGSHGIVVRRYGWFRIQTGDGFEFDVETPRFAWRTRFAWRRS